MLVLISFGLVLVAAVTLVAGIVADSLPLIYVSIASSVGAGVVLVIAVVTSRPSAAPGAEGPAPLEEAPPEPVAPAAPEPSPAAAPTRVTPAAPRPEPEPAPTPAATATGDDYFPIADYDELNVDEIVPLLDQLDAEELEMVREREVSGSGRVTVLRRIDELLEPEEEWAPAAVEEGPVGAGAEDEVAVVDEDEEYFPIADYDELNVSDINPLLDQLDDDELEMVREREEAGSGRVTILRKIDELLGVEEEPPAKKAPAKKRAASAAGSGRGRKKKAAAKKKAPAKKRAASAAGSGRGRKKKAPAKKRGGKKKAPAKKRGARR